MRKDYNQFIEKLPSKISLFMLIVIIVQTLGLISILTYSFLVQKFNLEVLIDIEDLFKNVVALNFIDIGIGVLSTMVSIWLGINIYNIATKEEIDQIKNDLSDIKEYENKINELRELESERKYNAWFEFTSILLKSSYVIDPFLSHILTSDHINKENLTMRYITLLKKFEIYYQDICTYYESNNYLEALRKIDMSKSVYEELKKEIDVCEEINFYLDCRIGDVKFYSFTINKNLGKYMSDDYIKGQELIDDWKRIEKTIKEINNKYYINYSDINSCLAYIYNTIGYSSELCNNNNYLNEAVEYMQKAVEYISDNWTKAKGRYYRNFGLIYEKKGDFKKSLELYNKALAYNFSDYKCWSNMGNIIIKKFEKDNNILKRTKVLTKLKLTKRGIDFDKSEEYFLNALHFDVNFRDPYVKLIQVYTYKYLFKKDNYFKEQALKYIKILDVASAKMKSFYFAKRNYYEAIGNIEEAIKINDLILQNNKDLEECQRLKDVYKKAKDEIDIWYF